MTTPSTTGKIQRSDMPGYESLYKVDFNFKDLGDEFDMEDFDVNVLSRYIVRVLANHPYNVDARNIVKIDVDEKNKIVTVVVSSEDVESRLRELTENKVELNNVVENVRNQFNHSDEDMDELEWINTMYPDKKYILEYKTPQGNSELYEYNFSGFDLAKNIYHENAVVMSGKTRHFLRNDDGSSSSKPASGTSVTFYSFDKPNGWYSYKIVVKQKQQEYYNNYN